MDGDERRSVTPSPAQAREWRRADGAPGVVDLDARLVQVQVHRHVELLGERDDAVEASVATVYGACGASRASRPACLNSSRASRPGPGEVVGVGRVGASGTRSPACRSGAHARSPRGAGGHVGEEVHVVQARDPAAQQLGARPAACRRARTPADTCARLGRPDVVLAASASAAGRRPGRASASSALWAWALTSPGISACVGRSTMVRASLRACLRRKAGRRRSAAVDGDRVVVEHAGGSTGTIQRASIAGRPRAALKSPSSSRFYR